MKNVTYLLGAGASANVLPIIKNFGDHIIVVSSEIRKIDSIASSEAGQTFLTDMQWLLERSNSHASLDTYAKKLYLKQEFDELKRLKHVLSGFFSIRQIVSPADSRYETFLASILTAGVMIPENIKIVSWNYDFQVEKAFGEFRGISDWNFLEQQLAVKQKFHLGTVRGGTLFKINGTADYIHNSRTSALKTFPFTDKNEKGLEESIRTIVNNHSKLYDLDEYSPRLSFAWEGEDEQVGIVQSAIEGIKQTEILVVIGYSFPFFNREADRLILNSMTLLEKIYIQDQNPNSIRSRLKSILPEFQNVDLIEDVGQFFLPHEL